MQYMYLRYLCYLLWTCAPFPGKTEKNPPSKNPSQPIPAKIPDPCKATMDAVMLGKQTLVQSECAAKKRHPPVFCRAFLTYSNIPQQIFLCILPPAGPSGKAYFFSGQYVWTVSGSGHNTPTLISALWRGMPGNINAAVHSQRTGKSYFLKGELISQFHHFTRGDAMHNAEWMFWQLPSRVYGAFLLFKCPFPRWQNVEIHRLQTWPRLPKTPRQYPCECWLSIVLHQEQKTDLFQSKYKVYNLLAVIALSVFCFECEWFTPNFRALGTGSGMKLDQQTSDRIPNLFRSSATGHPAILMQH